MEELLRLTRENNQMLKQIVAWIYNNRNDAASDFIMNIIANIIGNRVDPATFDNYGKN